MQGEQSDESLKLAESLLEFISETRPDLSEELTFDNKIDLLWSCCALGFTKQSMVVRQFFQELASLNFQRTDNDLSYRQFLKVKDILIYLARVREPKDEFVDEATNHALELLLRNPDAHQLRYEENGAQFDPFKKRVVEGVTRGLSMASIDHQSSLEGNMFEQHRSDLSFNEDLYPYKPDVIFGYQGNKVLLSVIPSTHTMKDTKQPDGEVQFHQRILKALNGEAKTVAVPITSVIDYDISNLQIKMNDSYDFMADLKSQLGQSSGLTINLDGLAKFGSQLTRDSSLVMESL